MKPYVLVVEDDEGIAQQLRWSLTEFEVVFAKTKEEAISQLRRYDPPIVTLDLGLPPSEHDASEGLATLKAILALRKQTKVILVSGQTKRAIAIEAMSQGAYDFFTKPIDRSELNLIAKRAYHVYQLEQDQDRQPQNPEPLKGLMTSCPSMLKIAATIEKLAPTNVSVLLQGESGTGKEVLAKAIHQQSTYSKGPFIAINCAAIPENLLESELFGYERGAFTGATKRKQGKIELANKGTLFLDEVGDLPLSLQPKLLRFLQEKEFDRLGGDYGIHVDVRIICATHHNIQEYVNKNVFRDDLYYRISEFCIEVPPLRERVGDAMLLARLFMYKYATEYNRKITGLTQESIEAINRYSWPGNVREIENRFKRAVIMADRSLITLEDLDLPLQDGDWRPFSLKEIRERAEKEAILEAVGLMNNNLSKAAERLGVTRPTLYNLMEKLGIREKTDDENV